MKSRILINATILNNPRLTGLGVYTSSLLPLLLDRLLESRIADELILAGHPERLRTTLGEVVSRSGISIRPVGTEHPLRRLLDLHRFVRRERRSARVLFYSPTHHGVVQDSIRQVITVHDLFAMIFPYNYRLQHYYFKYFLPRILACTDTVITDSVSTSRDLKKYFPSSPPALYIHAATSTALRDAVPEPVDGLSGERYFLFVGPNYWYKNCERLIEAFSVYRSLHKGKLVFVGGREDYLRTLNAQIRVRHTGIKDDIVFLDFVEGNTLSWLYGNAAATMVTTLYEGFGLPALEAMQFGCPVIASNAGSLPEVCGDAALLVDPESVHAIAAAMDRIVVDTDVRTRCISEGEKVASGFSWERAADEVYGVIRGVSD